MNKLPMILGFFVLVVLGLAAVTLIILFRPDATATIITAVTTLLGLASTAAVTFYLLNEQAKKIDEVKTHVNGNLSAEREGRIAAELKAEALQRQLLSVVGNAPAAPTAGEHVADPTV